MVFLRVLPPSCATHFYVAKVDVSFTFLQHKNVLRKKVVIRATNNLNLQRNIFARQVARKMLPVLLGLYFSFLSFLNVRFCDLFRAIGCVKGHLLVFRKYWHNDENLQQNVLKFLATSELHC